MSVIRVCGAVIYNLTRLLKMDFWGCFICLKLIHFILTYKTRDIYLFTVLILFWSSLCRISPDGEFLPVFLLPAYRYEFYTGRHTDAETCSENLRTPWSWFIPAIKVCLLLLCSEHMLSRHSARVADMRQLWSTWGLFPLYFPSPVRVGTFHINALQSYRRHSGHLGAFKNNFILQR